MRRINKKKILAEAQELFLKFTQFILKLYPKF